MALTEIDEKLLVQAYQAGDERAFDTIVRTQYNALYAHALRRLSSRESAEDAVQDTLLRAYRALPNLDGDLALRAWLHRILTNVCHDEGNRRRRQFGLVEKMGALPEELGEDPADEAALFDTVRVMAEALKKLPENYREALVLRYVDGLSFREVAEATGVSEENARARVHRGKSALHKIMSRMAIILAFLVPGLRRSQAPAASTSPAVDATVSSGVSDHAMSLTTQLTSHVMTAAPTMSRFAELSASMSGGKSALAAAAVTAVAAVSVPVAVHTVQDATKSPDRPAAATAAPAPERKADVPLLRGGSGNTLTAIPSTTSTSTSLPVSTTTTSTVPPSQEHPFESGSATPTTVTSRPAAPVTTTVKPPPTTTVTEAPPAPQVEARLVADDVDAPGSDGQYDVSGPVTLTKGSKSSTGTINGRVHFYEDGTGSAESLAVAIGGKSLVLRLRGDATTSLDADGSTTYQLTGAYSFRGAVDFGVPEAGDVTLVFHSRGDGRSSLDFDLRSRN